jgi:hemerythrin-like domain-containing protein
MKAVDVLVGEHRLIKRMAGVIEALADRLDRGQEVTDRLLGDVIDFSEQFTSNCHHAKEEHHLFPVLAQHGLGPDSSPIAALREQHEANHAYLREMHAALGRIRAGDPQARQAFAASARDYVRMIREHIRIEDHYFQDIASVLTPEEDATLTGRMTAIDRACERAGDLGRFDALVMKYETLMATW